MNKIMPNSAKKFFIVNLGTNYITLFISSLITLWLTPYLIRNLTLEVYGVIPLVTSLIAYFNMVTSSISQSVGKYVTVSYSKGDVVNSNVYYNTALATLAALCCVLVIPAIIISYYFPVVFNVPSGHEIPSKWLSIMVLSSSFFMACYSPFLVSIMITNKFFIENINQVISKLLRVGLLIIFFTFLTPSLVYFGLSYITMALFLLITHAVIAYRLLPDLRIKLSLYNFQAMKEMCSLSVWIVLESLGAMLYISISYMIINIFLGPKEGGRYGPIAELVMLFSLLGSSITKVFTPIVYRYIALNEYAIMTLQLKRAIKFICLTMAFPIGILCGLGEPVLQRWLGDDFTDLAMLLFIIMIPWLVSISTKPCTALFRGTDNAKIPALVTLLIGVFNVGIAIILVSKTNLGLYAIGISLLICLTVKNFVFTTMYAAKISGVPKYTFMQSVISGCIAFFAVYIIGRVLANMYFLATLPRLITVVVFGALIYYSLCYLLILNKDEKLLFKSLVNRS